MKKIFIWLGLIVFISVAYIFYNYLVVSNRPNVIFIILDAARADHFSCYGYPENTTPHIDAIAKDGAIFQNHFSNATYTTASISKIFSSRYYSIDIFQDDAWLWGVRKMLPENIFRQFDRQQIFLPNAFSLNNYTTAIFSNYGLLSAGYDEDSLVARFDEYFFSDKNPNEQRRNNELISKIISFVKHNYNKKLFIYCHIIYPHKPYSISTENKKFLSNIDRKTISIIREKLNNSSNDTKEMLDAEEMRCLKALYDSNLKYADTLVGILYERLKASGILNKTLLIITSDHGEHLGEHNLLFHGGVPWDSVTKVPLIIFYPPFISKGIKIKGFTESIDIMPTMLDICRIKLPYGKTMDGVSLLKYVKYPEKGKEAVFTEYSMRTMKYKYIKYETDEKMLYDIQKDPEEKNNIINQQTTIGNDLEVKYENAIAPYKKRYKEAVTESTPDFPFYIELGRFSITPESVVEKSYVYYHNLPEFLEKNLITRPWLLNKGLSRDKFLCPIYPPSILAEPITLSTLLPNGTYKVYIMLGSMQKICYPIEKLGLKYRTSFEIIFNYPYSLHLLKSITEGKCFSDHYVYENLSFIYPSNIELFSTDNYKFYYYLSFGNIAIKNHVFQIQLKFHQPDKNIYTLHHIKFVPVGNEGLSSREKLIENEAFQRKRESLKSLGYL